MTDRDDPSNGYEAVAEDYIAVRSASGQALVRDWVKAIPAPAAILDLGAGFGEPITRILVEAGHKVSAIEASPAMVAAFQARLRGVEIACEPVEESDFFGRKYDAILAVGLIFLLPEAAQTALIAKVAAALKPGGRFLFSAPTGTWDDLLTGRRSVSLGAHAYRNALTVSGFEQVKSREDEGGSHYYDAIKTAA